ncbi:MAG: glycosyltransferase family 4 protein [Kiritimatiellae bacterium]|nr:glycosyltransferase family 4 protein [Kiritimatiellia bacterium]MCB1102155.1 glycosyltransferase family 4 protein [Kiritimatiellia bacterium]
MKTPMPHVILISGRDPLEEIGGGHCAYVRAHARAALAAGFHPHLFCVSDRARDVETDFGTVHRMADRGLAHRQTMIRFHAPTLAQGMGEFTRDHPVDAIHGFGVWSYAGALLKARLGPDSPRFIMSMYTVYAVECQAQLDALGHYPWGRERLRQRIEVAWVQRMAAPCEHRAVLAADVVGVNYDSVQALIKQHHGSQVPIRKVHYGPESVFLPPFPTRAPEGEAWLGREGPLYLTITLQRPKKGTDILIEAMARLAHRGQPGKLCIVGGGPMMGQHRKLAHALGIGDRVLFTGFVEDVRPWLNLADIYVQPSLREESGALAMLEAMQLGKPVVCSAIDGLREDIADGITGLLVPPMNSEALAEAMIRMQDPDLRATIGQEAIRSFDRRFGAKVFARDIQTLYGQGS